MQFAGHRAQGLIPLASSTASLIQGVLSIYF